MLCASPQRARNRRELERERESIKKERKNTHTDNVRIHRQRAKNSEKKRQKEKSRKMKRVDNKEIQKICEKVGEGQNSKYVFVYDYHFRLDILSGF